MDRYKTKKAAIQYFEKMRWGDESVCVKCGCTGRITAQKKAGDYWCGDCRSYFNAFTGTPLERNKVDPRKWVYATYTLMTSRKGISSLQLSKEIGVQQRTAWYMLHRLRLACGGNLEALSGEVEMDATYIGGAEKNKHSDKKLKAGRGTVGKQAVLGMRQCEGRVKAMPVTGEDKATIHSAVLENIEVGTTIYTDDHSGYKSLGSGDYYQHESVKHSAREYVNGMAHTNGVESVWSVLKRGFNGVYHNYCRRSGEAYRRIYQYHWMAGIKAHP